MRALLGNARLAAGGADRLRGTRKGDRRRAQRAGPALPAQIEFIRLEPGKRYDVAGLTVDLMLQRHSGDSYGYRFSAGGNTVIYSTDSEHPLTDPDDSTRFVEFFRDANVVIFDAMYSLADAISVKADWGHSSNIVGVELCHAAREIGRASCRERVWVAGSAG